MRECYATAVTSGCLELDGTMEVAVSPCRASCRLAGVIKLDF